MSLWKLSGFEQNVIVQKRKFKLSGSCKPAFLDRMDLCVEASSVEYGELHKTGKEETSEEIRNRVCTARKIQEQRYEGTISGQTPESEYGRWKNFAKLEKKKKN